MLFNWPSFFNDILVLCVFLLFGITTSAMIYFLVIFECLFPTGMQERKELPMDFHNTFILTYNILL